MIESLHLSELTLWQLRNEELASAERATLVSHLHECARCQALADELTAESQAFQTRDAEAFAHALLAQKHVQHRNVGRRRWALPAGLGFGFAAAAAMVALILLPHPDDMRAKGEPVLAYVFARDGVQQPMSDDLRHHAGDALMLQYERGAADQRFVFVVGVEEGRPVHAYYPWDGSESAEAHPGLTTLPHALRLDAGPGPEELIAVFSEEPLEFHHIVQAVDAARGQGAQPGSIAESLELVGAAATSVVLRWEQ